MNARTPTRPRAISMEKALGFPALYMAWLAVDEVRNHFRVNLPEAAEAHLVERAERVFAHHPRWQRRFAGAHGRAYLRSFMRHWLSAWLRRHRSPLFEQLPNSFMIGHPLQAGHQGEKPRPEVTSCSAG